MEGIVDDRLGAGRFMVFLDDTAQRLAAMLRGKRDHRRRAAKGRRYRSAVEIVGADDAGRRTLLDMTMAVDAARQDESAGCIDFTLTPAEVLAERRHHAVLDADVAGDRIGRGGDGAAADHQIIFAHAAPLLLPVRRALL